MILKAILRLLKISFGTLAALVLVYLLAAFVLARIPVEGEETQNKDVTIYLLTNGVHTDLVLPVKMDLFNWNNIINVSHTEGQDTTATYVAFGWGDKGFFLETPTWADLKARTAFRAAFSLSTAAIHATFYQRGLKESAACKKIQIGEQQYMRLVNYIQNSFILTSHGRAIPIATNANYDTNDAFYEAMGTVFFSRAIRGQTTA